MEEYSHIELVSLCDSILGSGEVTENDAYNLADWLNNHREACFHWPGERLVAPLQQIWADGKVTPTESRRLADLLRSILKEWTKIYYDESMKGAHQRVQELIAVLPPTEPRLPGIELTLRIKSHTQKLVSYNVDLSGPNCTCPDWQGCRYDLPIGHLTRCCKHVFDAYTQIIPLGLWPGWIGAFVNIGWAVSPKTQWFLISLNNLTWLVSTPGGENEWMNFYTQADEDYERLGYSLAEERWAYGVEPSSAKKLLQLALARDS